MSDFISNALRGAVQFLASIQPLVDSDELKLKIQALKLLQTTIAYGSGSDHLITEWAVELSEFDQIDKHGENGFLRHFRPFFNSLTNLESPLDNDTARCIAFFLKENLIEFEFDGDMLEKFGKFAIAYMATLYPYPVKFEDYSIMEEMLMSVCPDEVRLSFKDLLKAKCPFKKDENGTVISKTDDEMRAGFSVVVRRIGKRKK